MVVLVTGGAGFVGAATVALLRSVGREVLVLDDLSTGRAERVRGVPLLIGDVRDEGLVTRAVQGADAVLHLAARSSVPGSFADPVGCHAVNDEGTAVVLEAAWQAGVHRVVLASSSAVYGELSPAREDRPLDPRSPYAASKAAMEAQGQVYRHRGMAVTSLRYFNVYGPGQPSGPLGAVIPRFIKALQRGCPLPMEGSGRQGRDFVHVHDVARANLGALNAPSGIFNIGTGVLTTVVALAEQISSLAGVPIRIQRLPGREAEVLASVACVTLAAQALGWRSETTLTQGLTALIGHQYQAQEG
jgi:nucleoside-diphosphate-sugar epimerase